MDEILATSTDAGEISIDSIRGFIETVMNVYRMIIDALKSVIKPLLEELFKSVAGGVATDTDA